MRRLAWMILVVPLAAASIHACHSRDIEGDAPGECGDGADNDRDGLFDCDDPDCLGAPSCSQVVEDAGSDAGMDGGLTEWLQLASGGVHNCGIRTDQTLGCWGSNVQGQSTPPAGSFSDVRVSFSHSCGIGTDGKLSCWGCKGDQDYGQCDVPTTLGDVARVDTGTYATCAAAQSTGEVTCWGCAGTDHGQCTPPAGAFDALAAGSLHVCGLMAGTPICWGSDDYGQSTPPAASYRQISAGTWHTCGVRTDDGVDCWGCNSPGPTMPADFGQCDVPSGSFKQVAAGVYHTCGLKTDGSVVCWGCIGTHDGNNTDGGQCTPPSETFEAIGVGKYHGCGLRADGRVRCWGDDAFGQLAVP